MSNDSLMAWLKVSAPEKRKIITLDVERAFLLADQLCLGQVHRRISRRTL